MIRRARVVLQPASCPIVVGYHHPHGHKQGDPLPHHLQQRAWAASTRMRCDEWKNESVGGKLDPGKLGIQCRLRLIVWRHQIAGMWKGGCGERYACLRANHRWLTCKVSDLKKKSPGKITTYAKEQLSASFCLLFLGRAGRYQCNHICGTQGARESIGFNKSHSTVVKSKT